jgi:hypothetical protein
MLYHINLIDKFFKKKILEFSENVLQSKSLYGIFKSIKGAVRKISVGYQGP